MPRRNLLSKQDCLYIDREIAAHPNLVQIETTWRPAKEQRPGVLAKHSYYELEDPENPDAEPSCPHIRTALVVFGRHAGKTLTVCTENDCPGHDPDAIARRARQQAEYPAPVMAEPEPEEPEEEAAERKAAYELQKQQHEAEQTQREEERRAELDRQQKEYEAQRQRREKVQKARSATFDRIVENAPTLFTATQLRAFLKLMLHVDSYNYLEEAANHFATDDDHDRAEQDILLSALDTTADDKLTGFALRLVLTDHVAIPREGNPDSLTDAAAVFNFSRLQKTRGEPWPGSPLVPSSRPIRPPLASCAPEVSSHFWAFPLVDPDKTLCP